MLEKLIVRPLKSEAKRINYCFCFCIRKNSYLNVFYFLKKGYLEFVRYAI